MSSKPDGVVDINRYFISQNVTGLESSYLYDGRLYSDAGVDPDVILNLSNNRSLKFYLMPFMDTLDSEKGEEDGNVDTNKILEMLKNPKNTNDLLTKFYNFVEWKKGH